ncbi:hypothetical protein [Phaeobacter inhibens]|uniref:hypothetical protein n=1 Tax=Phaeobacter inhibens TaxID=221822 RepID=UPI00076BB535|nr:hypothetical protein [Phaeobacter inhibens]KXF91552.1 hypothetical protein AT574_06410 [Phaeobacter inhibens]WHP68841.1 hypothetical protein QMZ01_01240 [Phaeobacter inhibens]
MQVIGTEELTAKLAKLGESKPNNDQPKSARSELKWVCYSALFSLGILVGTSATYALTAKESSVDLSPGAINWIVLEIAQARDITPNTARRLLDQQGRK